MSINLYPLFIHRGELSPGDRYDDDVDDVCTKIYKACDGRGTDTQYVKLEANIEESLFVFVNVF